MVEKASGIWEETRYFDQPSLVEGCQSQQPSAKPGSIGGPEPGIIETSREPPRSMVSNAIPKWFHEHTWRSCVRGSVAVGNVGKNMKKTNALKVSKPTSIVLCL